MRVTIWANGGHCVTEPGLTGSLAGLAIVLGLGAGAALLCRACARLRGRPPALPRRDPLTGCLTRTAFTATLADDLRRQPVTVCVLDLDHFESVNDTWGHATGDALLAAVGRCLRDRLGPGARIARLGSDAFWVALPGPARQANADRLEAARQAIGAVIPTPELPHVTRSASAGVVHVPAGTDPAEAIRAADLALALAKAQGRDQLEADAEAVHRAAAARARRPGPDGIRAGLDRDEFTYFVQPVRDLSTDRVLGVEALLRWVRPDGRVLTPDQFLGDPALPGTRPIRPPLEMTRALAAMFATLPEPCFTAFNLSGRVLRSADTGTRLRALIETVDPARLVFEIVEDAGIEDDPAALPLLRDLRQAGARIALDDFGTGRSNLARLLTLPVDIVKFDRAFTVAATRPRARTILARQIAMAEDLGLDMIAEGLETEAQRALLLDLGLRCGQGYLLGTPAPATDWAARIAADRRPAQAAE